MSQGRAQFLIDIWFFILIGESHIPWISWVDAGHYFWEDVKSGKEMEWSPHKKYCCDFSPQSALCPVCFWVHVMDVLDMLWALGVCNMSLGSLCALWTINNMEGYGCKTCPGITQFVLENMNVAKGRLAKRTAFNLYWLHSISLPDLIVSLLLTPGPLELMGYDAGPYFWPLNFRGNSVHR